MDAAGGGRYSTARPRGFTCRRLLPRRRRTCTVTCPAVLLYFSRLIRVILNPHLLTYLLTYLLDPGSVIPAGSRAARHVRGPRRLIAPTILRRARWRATATRPFVGLRARHTPISAISISSCSAISSYSFGDFHLLIRRFILLFIRRSSGTHSAISPPPPSQGPSRRYTLTKPTRTSCKYAGRSGCSCGLSRSCRLSGASMPPHW